MMLLSPGEEVLLEESSDEGQLGDDEGWREEREEEEEEQEEQRPFVVRKSRRLRLQNANLSTRLCLLSEQMIRETLCTELKVQA